MTETEIGQRSAGSLVAALRAGELSSAELLEHFLARVEKWNPPLNAVVTLDVERAREAARAADAARERGEALGPLHGLPMTVKDTFETAGLRTTAGTPRLSRHVPDEDAVVVARLRAAGAVIFGKTNTPEWAADWQTDNPVFGTTRNPWDPERSPGGSSGGSAAALAAGLTPLELGSDIGGSIRVPSHWSGVCGHKPSHGIVPQRGHLPPWPGTRAERDLNVIGPLARYVDDLERALDVLAGPDEPTATAWTLALPPPRQRELGDFRVAAWLDDAAFPADAEMRRVLEEATAALESEGARIDRTARPAVPLAEAVQTYLDLLMPTNTLVQDDESFAAMQAGAWALPPEAEGLVVDALRSHVIAHRDWLRSHERREKWRAAWAEFFRGVDVLLCPVTLTAAIGHDHGPVPGRTVEIDGHARPYLELVAWPGLVSMALLPATVVPVGRTREGLPVGIQIVAPFLEDRTGLAFARCVEAVLGGCGSPPGFA
ncbi:MAG: amidase [Proteobacteria bacterium]|nr:amidase [Pseudomonadota bacterium]